MPRTPKLLNKKYPKIFYRIGAISLQWNTADYYLEQLLKSYMMFEDEWASIFLDTWGNETRATVLNRIITTSEGDQAFRDYALHITKFFEICRENRNFVVHGIVRKIEKESFIIERFSRRQHSRSDFLITLNILERVESSIILLCAHLRLLMQNNAKVSDLLGKRASLPDRPLLPDRLTKTQTPIPRTEAPPPESYEE